MKTPEQIAKDIIGDTLKDDGKVVRVNPSIVFRWIERAVYYERIDQAYRDGYATGRMHAKGE